MATATIKGEVLGTPNAKMREQLKNGGPKLFTPWIAGSGIGRDGITACLVSRATLSMLFGEWARSRHYGSGSER